MIPFFSPFPTAHPRAGPINVTFRTQPESEPVFCPNCCHPGPGCSPLEACSALLPGGHRPPSFHSVHSCAHPHLSTTTRRIALKSMLDHLLALKSFRAPCLTQRIARPLTVISDAAGNGPLLPFTLSPPSRPVSLATPAIVRSTCEEHSASRHLTVAVSSVWKSFPSEIFMTYPSFLHEGSPGHPT